MKTNLINQKENILIENLQELKKIFDESGIEFWLDWGTLLGAVRDKKIIPWDTDIDLGIMGNDYKKVISTFPKFKEKGFVINEVPIPIGSSDFSHRKLSFSRSGYSIDMWPYFKKDNNWILFSSMYVFENLKIKRLSSIPWVLWCLLLSAERNPQKKYKSVIEAIVKFFLFLFPKKIKKFLIKKLEKLLFVLTATITVPKCYFERLEKIEYYGMAFNIPSDVESYLKYKYGKNWKMPDKKWDWRKDDRTISSFAG